MTDASDPAAVGPAGAAVVTLRCADADAMRDLGRRLGAMLLPGDVVLLDGPLGAGKTTLTQGIAEGLGVRGPVTSPTFVIARVHPPLSGGPALVHVDAYRVGTGLEIDDLDLDADVDTAVTVIEWGAGPARRLAEERLEISIERATGGAGVEGAAIDVVGTGGARAGGAGGARAGGVGGTGGTGGTGVAGVGVGEAGGTGGTGVAGVGVGGATPPHEEAVRTESGDADEGLGSDPSDPRVVRIVGVGRRWTGVLTRV